MKYFVEGIIEVMTLVHAHGIVHFVIKPSNILLDAAFSPAISDFGLAKTIGSAKTVSGLANSRVFGFTPCFAAPELLWLAPAGMVVEADKKVDVYAFAITLWELLHRRKVWTQIADKDVKTCVMAGERPPVDDSISQRYPGLVALIRQSWNQNAARRPAYSSMLE